MNSGEPWRLGRCPALDGLRGVAILLVMLTHLGIPGLQGAGSAGVTMFFTLSGFLIAALLLDERSVSGQVALAAFLSRRARRLLPALVLFLATMSMLGLTTLPVAPSWRDLLGVLGGVGNLTVAMQGHDTVITQTWSLSVEEQFYVLWPLVLVVCLRLGRGSLRLLAVLAAAGVVYPLVMRLVLWDGGAGALRVYVGTDTRMDGLLVGCVAAMWMHGRRPGTDRPWVATAAVCVVVGLSVTTGAAAIVGVPTVVPWLTSAAIVALVQQSGAGWLSHRIIRAVGERSYGLFLWHYPLWAVARAVPGPLVVPAFLCVALLTFAIAHLSWHCVELPFLRGRGRPSVAVTKLSVEASDRSDVRLDACALSSGRGHGPAAEHRRGAVLPCPRGVHRHPQPVGEAGQGRR
jgi:peptidoglycan/LPS O-acetylase OafA/YrhL